MVSVALAERVTSPAEAPWLGTTDTVTVVASADARSSVAVTVLVPPFSAMEAEERTSVTVGSASSSVTFTVTEPVTSAYPPPEAWWETVVDRPSLSTSSSTPVTVTVWAVFQLPVVKVSDVGETVATAVSPLAAVTVTDPVGREVSLTV